MKPALTAFEQYVVPSDRSGIETPVATPRPRRRRRAQEGPLWSQLDRVAYVAIGFAALFSLLHLKGFGPDRKAVLLTGALLFGAAIWTTMHRPRRLPLLLAAYLPFNLAFPYTFGFSINLTNVLVGLHVVALVAAKRENRGTVVRIGAFERLLATFLVLGLLSHVAATYAHRDLGVLEFAQAYKVWCFPFLIYFLVRALVRNRDDRRNLLVVLLATTMLIGVVCWRLGFYASGAGSIASSRVDGLLRQANQQAAFLVYYGLPLLAVGLTRKHLKSRAVAFVGFLVVARALIYTYSRGGFLAMAVGVFAALFLRGPLVLVGAVGGYLAVASQIPAVIPDAVLARFGHTLDGPQQPYSDDAERLDPSVGHRLQSWKIAAQLLKDNPAFGVGPGRYQAAMRPYMQQAVAYKTDGMDAHNAYALVAAELGAPGIACMLACLCYAGVVALLLYFRAEDSLDRGIALAFIASLCGVMVSSMFGSRFADDALIGNFWILAAITFSLRQEIGRPRRRRV